METERFEKWKQFLSEKIEFLNSEFIFSAQKNWQLAAEFYSTFDKIIEPTLTSFEDYQKFDEQQKSNVLFLSLGNTKVFNSNTLGVIDNFILPKQLKALVITEDLEDNIYQQIETLENLDILWCFTFNSKRQEIIKLPKDLIWLQSYRGTQDATKCTNLLIANGVKKIHANKSLMALSCTIDINNFQLFDLLKEFTSLQSLDLKISKELNAEQFEINLQHTPLKWLEIGLFKNTENFLTAFCQCKTLTKLDISFYWREERGLKKYPSEKYTIPKEIQNLYNLKELNIKAYGDGCISLPKEISKLVDNLEILSISDSVSSDTFELITNLSNLQTLDLSNNQLENLPNLGKLINLKWLNLSSNKLDSISSEIGNLTKLKHLNLQENKLKFLPKEICSLIYLRDLYLDNNELKEYPLNLFRLTQLHTLYEDTSNISNPLDNMPEAKEMGLIELFSYLKNKAGISQYDVYWDIPEDLKTPFQRYLAGFDDYVAKRTNGKKIKFNPEKIELGLKLNLTTENGELSLEEIDMFLREYIGIALKNGEHLNQAKKDLSGSSENQLATLKQNMYIRDLENEVRTIQGQLQNYQEITRVELRYANDKIEDKDKTITELRMDKTFLQNQLQQNIEQLTTVMMRFFQDQHSIKMELPMDNQFGILKIILSEVVEKIAQHFPLQKQLEMSSSFDADRLLVDLIDKAKRIQTQRLSNKDENEITKEFAEYLCNRGYIAKEQALSGTSATGKKFGSLDILVTNQNNVPLTIIEAFNLKSCGDSDTSIDAHINKLLSNYDTSGFKTNFVLIYAKAVKFSELWENYKTYINELNKKPNFVSPCQLKSFHETAKSDATDIRVGLAIHEREGQAISVFHIFIHMYTPPKTT